MELVRKGFVSKSSVRTELDVVKEIRFGQKF